MPIRIVSTLLLFQQRRTKTVGVTATNKIRQRNTEKGYEEDDRQEQRWQPKEHRREWNNRWEDKL